MSQAAQFSVHAPSQHTESAQNPLVHAPGAVHGSPFAFFATHAPAAQCMLGRQSPSSTQLVAHAPALQTPNGAHVRAPWGAPLVMMEQVPRKPATSQATQLPEQAVSQHTPSTQRPEPHSDAVVHVVPSVARQRPGDAVLAHVLSVPQVAASQHTPSVQKPCAHWLPLVHAVPSAR
jgi:hypothetical protein